MPKHFTAVVEIQKVDIVELRGTGRDADKTVRTPGEVARVIVRADTLEKLVEKTKAHLSLIEE